MPMEYRRNNPNANCDKNFSHAQYNIGESLIMCHSFATKYSTETCPLTLTNYLPLVKLLPSIRLFIVRKLPFLLRIHSHFTTSQEQLFLVSSSINICSQIRTMQSNFHPTRAAYETSFLNYLKVELRIKQQQS